MDAEDLRAFDELASDTGLSLWPVTDLRVGGIAVEGTGPVPEVKASLVEGATLLEGECSVWVKKSLLGVKPAVDSVFFAHGRDWLVREVKGDSATEAEWWVRGEVKN